jgi:hypothetical protein
MAQETRVNPIQLDNTASQIMMSMADSIDRSKERDKALAAEKERERMRIEAEEQKRLYQQNKEVLSSMFDPSKLRAETRAAMVDDILTNTTDFLKGGMKGGTDAQVADNALKQLMNITAGDAKYANILKSIDDREKSLTDDERKGYNIGEAKQVAVRNAFKKQDAKGNWVPKSNEELDDSQDYLGTLINSPEGLKFANLSTGYNALAEKITKAPKSTETLSLKVQRGLKRTSETNKITFSPKYQRYDDKNEEIVLNTDKNGFLLDEVYKDDVSDPSVNRMLTSRAVGFVNDYNTADDKGKAAMAAKAGLPPTIALPKVLDPADGAILENIKKAFHTQTVANQIGKVESEAKQDIIFQPRIETPTTPTDPTNTAPNDRITAIMNLDPRFLGAATKTSNGNIMYDVTGQFDNLPIFSGRQGRSYGPVEVRYNSGTQQFFVRSKAGEPLKLYQPQSWRDVVIPKTVGTNYNPAPKPPKKPNPLAPKN